jgi:nicotinamidase-related amidase
MTNLGNWRLLCIDMQRMFAEDTPWQVEWMNEVLPQVEELAGRFPEKTIFPRFIPPVRAEGMPGAWQDYYRQLWMLTRKHTTAEMADLVPSLDHLIPVARSTSGRTHRGQRANCIKRLSLNRSRR